MAKLTIRDAIPADAEYIAANLRKADARELTAAHGMVSTEDLIFRSAASSAQCWTALLDDVPVCIFGAASSSPGVGVPWLMATESWEELSPRKVWATCFKHVDKMRSRYHLLLNYVHVENEVAIRWLKQLGFVVNDKSVPYGKYGAPFCLFWAPGDM